MPERRRVTARWGWAASPRKPAVTLLASLAQARTWTGADGSKTFEGELKSYDAATGMVHVTLSDGGRMSFQQEYTQVGEAMGKAMVDLLKGT